MSNTNLSRRDLFKFSGIAAAGLAGAAALSGCASPKSASEKTADKTTSNRRNKPEAITNISETVECNLIVVGAGNGGLVGAMTAQEAGFDVIVLEKSGAIAQAREAIGTIGSRHSQGHEPDIPTLMNHTKTMQSGDVNMALYRT